MDEKLEVLGDHCAKPVSEEDQNVRTITIGFPSNGQSITAPTVAEQNELVKSSKIVIEPKKPVPTERKRPCTETETNEGDAPAVARKVRLFIMHDNAKNQEGSPNTGKYAIERTVTILTPQTQKPAPDTAETEKPKEDSPKPPPTNEETPAAPSSTVDDTINSLVSALRRDATSKKEDPAASTSGMPQLQAATNGTAEMTTEAQPEPVDTVTPPEPVIPVKVEPLTPSNVACVFCGILLGHAPYPPYIIVTTVKQICPKRFNSLLGTVHNVEQRTNIARTMAKYINKQEVIRLCASHFDTDLSDMGRVQIAQSVERIYIPSPLFVPPLEPHCAVCGSTNMLSPPVRPKPLPFVLSSNPNNGGNVPGLRESLLDLLTGILRQFDFFGSGWCCMLCCDMHMGALRQYRQKSLDISFILAARTSHVVNNLKAQGIRV